MTERETSDRERAMAFYAEHSEATTLDALLELLHTVRAAERERCAEVAQARCAGPGIATMRQDEARIIAAEIRSLK